MCSLLPLSVGDEGVVEGKERVPSPADYDAVRFCYHEQSSKCGECCHQKELSCFYSHEALAPSVSSAYVNRISLLPSCIDLLVLHVVEM